MISHIEKFEVKGSVSMGGDVQAQKPPYIWRLPAGMIPPTETIGFDSNFSIREIAQKSRVFCRESVGGRAINEIIFEKFRFYMVRKNFRRPKCLFQIGILGILGKMPKLGPKTPQNRQKWTKMDKVGQKRIFRMMQSRHVHIQPCTLSAGMCAPCQGIL